MTHLSDRDAALEEAAKWHDLAASECDAKAKAIAADDFVPWTTWSNYRDFHRHCAAKLRAIKSSPTPPRSRTSEQNDQGEP